MVRHYLIHVCPQNRKTIYHQFKVFPPSLGSFLFPQKSFRQSFLILVAMQVSTKSKKSYHPFVLLLDSSSELSRFGLFKIQLQIHPHFAMLLCLVSLNDYPQLFLLYVTKYPFVSLKAKSAACHYLD